MKYTVVLRRSESLMDIFEDEEFEFYVANGDREFANPKQAFEAARKEAAKADLPDLQYMLAERGIRGNLSSIDPDDYELVLVIEGQHNPVLWGFQL